jgi:hypothetical protein
VDAVLTLDLGTETAEGLEGFDVRSDVGAGEEMGLIEGIGEAIGLRRVWICDREKEGPIGGGKLSDRGGGFHGRSRLVVRSLHGIQGPVKAFVRYFEILSLPGVGVLGRRGGGEVRLGVRGQPRLLSRRRQQLSRTRWPSD